MPASSTPSERLLLGNTVLFRTLYNEQAIPELWEALVNRYTQDPTDFEALLDLSVMVHATGQPQKGREMQSAALRFKKIYKRKHGTGKGLRVAALMVEGDMTANTPIDFLLVQSDFMLYTVFVDEKTLTLSEIPDVDVIFMAIGESPANQGVLRRVEELLNAWHDHPPIINRDVGLIAKMTRDRLHRELSNDPAILSPPQVIVSRAEIEEIAAGRRRVEEFLPGYSMPVIVRPVGTHAGNGLELIESPDSLSNYLQRMTEGTFYMAPFIEYRSPDGLYRKQRIVFIKRRPFACHMAISSHWMVHYLSAEMNLHPERRAEEAEWMESFDSVFAKRYASALEKLCDAYAVDYFAVDCIPISDGRMLVFEADNIMIVHDLDDDPMFHYKKPIMHKLFRSFQDMLTNAALEDRPEHVMIEAEAQSS